MGTGNCYSDAGAMRARHASRLGRGGRVISDEDGSVVTEYGLLAVVVATVAALLIQWVSGGALLGLFDDLLASARSIVGL
ncbi:MAG: hypothetical protein WD358_02195 [Nitriliruptoraceae bacterium]